MNVELLPSPLNLFANTLELEFGASRFLHYGLFESAPVVVESLPDAQQRFSDVIQQRIIKFANDGARILVASSTLHHLALKLAAQGFDTSWLDRGDNQEHGSGSCGKLHTYVTSIFEFADTVRFDVIVLGESIRYLDQLEILSKCRHLLKVDGNLLLFGEFLDDDSAVERSQLPNLSSFKQLSQRLGYELREDIDYSSSAGKTLDLFLALLQKHQGKLLNEFAIMDSEIVKAEHALHTAIEEYGSGRRCFRVLQLGRFTEPSGEYVNAEYGDINSFQPDEISRLFEKSFNTSFDPALWQWKYQLGDGKCVIARIEKEGEIVAHYGGAPRQISYFGSPSMAIQPCDVMVLPENRSQYGKSSLFFKVATTFLEREIGNTVNHLLGFGFPNQKAMNIATRLGLYEKTDDFVEVLYVSPEPLSNTQSLTATPLDLNDESQQLELDHLWQLMQLDYAHAIIGVRNWQYMKYRYIDHPFAKSNQYQCVVIRAIESGKACAVAVLKDHAKHRLVMDLVCPLEAMQSVLLYLNQRLSEENQQQALAMWITKSWAEKINLPGAIVNELGIEIPCNSWNPGPSSKILYGAWWLTAGDMDFV